MSNEELEKLIRDIKNNISHARGTAVSILSVSTNRENSEALFEKFNCMSGEELISELEARKIYIK